PYGRDCKRGFELKCCPLHWYTHVRQRQYPYIHLVQTGTIQPLFHIGNGHLTNQSLIGNKNLALNNSQNIGHPQRIEWLPSLLWLAQNPCPQSKSAISPCPQKLSLNHATSLLLYLNDLGYSLLKYLPFFVPPIICLPLS